MTYQRGATYPLDYNWQAAFRIGEDLALEYHRSGTRVTPEAIMWALLRDAIRTSAIAYPAPPRTGYPVKSTMPDSPDEVSQWQRIAAYLRGDLDEMPTDEGRPPRPDAATITRADIILHIWHNNVSLPGRAKKAVYIKAAGRPDRKVRAITGYSRDKIKAAKRRALREMLESIGM